MVSPRVILAVMLISWCRGAIVRTREECSHRHWPGTPHEDQPEHEILCSVDGTPSYAVTTVPGRYYNLYCKSTNALNEKNLPYALKSDGGPLKSYFLFSHCPLPSTSYADVMRHLGVTATTRLMIRRLSSSDPIERRHLQGLDKLGTRVLNLYDSGIRDIPEDLFQDVPNLIQLELSTNKLRVSSGRTFKNLKNLRVLKASNADLSNIPAGLFALPALEKLFLSRNSLNLTSYTFRGASSLKTLDLRSNSLNSLPRDVFQDLINLRQVDLSNNPLTALPRGLFRHNKKMVNLFMDRSSESLEDTLYELKEATGCDFVENNPGQFVNRCIDT